MLLWTAIRSLHTSRVGHGATRLFSTLPALLEKPLPPRFVIPETDIDESFLKGSGPGGQKINKTSSAVQLKHLPTGMVVKCQETRSRAQNRKIAGRILADKLEDIEKGDQSRTALKAERARKKKASASKKSRRKYKKLEDGTTVEEDDQDHGDEDGALDLSEDNNELDTVLKNGQHSGEISNHTKQELLRLEALVKSSKRNLNASRAILRKKDYSLAKDIGQTSACE